MTPPDKKSPKRGRGPSSKELSNGPSLRFHHSDALQARMEVVLDTLEAAEDPEEHSGALADLVSELTESGMDYYYMRALKLSGAGFVAQRSAGVGISGAVRMISTVSRQFIMRMDGKQLRAVASHIRSLSD